MDPEDPLEVPAAAAFHPDERTRELCLQYQRVLSAALAGDPDPRLCDASILEVAPHPDACSVLVIVVAGTERLEDARTALEEATERLRRELQRNLDQRPELGFRLIPSPPISS